jgi:hypothetical protein
MMKNTGILQKLTTFLHSTNEGFSQVLDDAVDNSKTITPDNPYVQAAYKHHIYINPQDTITLEAFAEIKQKAAIRAAMEAYRRANDIPSIDEQVREIEESGDNNIMEFKKLYDRGLLKRNEDPSLIIETDAEMPIERRN